MKKKVLMVHNYYQIGGGEHTVFENEVQLLKENGHDVITYTRSNDELKSSRIKLLLSPLSTIWSLKTYFEIKKIIKNDEIDIVHCHNTFPLISPSVYYAARHLKIPVIQTIHNFRLLCPSGTLYIDGKICEQCIQSNSFSQAIKSKCYRNSKVQTLIVVAMLKFHRLIGTYGKISYIFLTEFNKKKFEKLIDINGDNVFVKPNFTNTLLINKSSSSNIHFVFAGRLEANKGILFLLQAWEKLPENFELHIYGDGTLKNEVLRYVNKNKNIVFYGFQPQKVIFEDLIRSKGFIFPSELYEGFPMVISESFSLGIPVVSTNIGNQNNLLSESKAGRTFVLKNQESFCEAILDVLDNQRQYSSNALNYYNLNLTKEKNYEMLRSIYENAKHI